MGMIAQGANHFAGMSCPANTYGAAGRVYGLRAAPCKPCPRHMITDGLTNVNSSDTCINPDGFGKLLVAAAVFLRDGLMHCFAPTRALQPCLWQLHVHRCQHRIV
jgi:hypothetical protein